MWLPGVFCALLRHFCDVLAKAAPTISGISSFMVFALPRTSSIVRLWELIACKVCPIYFTT